MLLARITRIKTLVAYLPLRKELQRKQLEKISFQTEGSFKSTPLLFLHMLHTCMEKTMDPLAKIYLRCFQATISDELRYRVYLMPASYVSDLAEVLEQLSLKSEALQRPLSTDALYIERTWHTRFLILWGPCVVQWKIMAKNDECSKKAYFLAQFSRCILCFQCSRTSQYLEYTHTLTCIACLAARWCANFQVDCPHF